MSSRFPAVVVGLAAVAVAIFGGLSLSQGGGSRGGVSALSVSPGRDVSCTGNVPDAGTFALNCEVLSSAVTPPAATPTPPLPTPTTAPSASATRTAPSPIPPTSTGTPTPTATAPPASLTATPTPRPGSTLDQIIADLTGSNPACIAGTEGYDWGGLLPFTGVEKNGPVYRGNNIPPNGAAHLTVWLMMNQEANCNGGAELSPNTNGAITVSGLKVWYLLSSGQWRAFDDARIWGWQDNDPNYQGPIYASACCFNADSPYTVPHGRGKQAYTAQNEMPAGVVGFLAVYNARSTGGMLMVNCGADYYQADYGYIGDLMVGKFHALGPVDTLVSCTNVSAATLRANPPPLP